MLVGQSSSPSPPPPLGGEKQTATETQNLTIEVMNRENKEQELMKSDLESGSRNSRAGPRVMNWATLFANRNEGGTTKLHYVPTPLVEGKKVVHIRKCDHEKRLKECESYLIGNFVGKRLGYGFVKDRLKQLWTLKSDFEMSIYGDRAYVFQFNNEEDRVKAMEFGPVHIASRIFVVRPWQPYVEQSIEVMNSVPIWVHLRGVPLFLWSPSGLQAIASALGQPLLLDKATESRSRLSYARVCVEVDANSPFPDSIPITIDDGKEINVSVEYSWKPGKCKQCMGFGHLSSSCPKNKKPRAQETRNKYWRPTDPGSKKHTAATDPIGNEDGWMIAGGKHTFKHQQNQVVQANLIAETDKGKEMQQNDIVQCQSDKSRTEHAEVTQHIDDNSVADPSSADSETAPSNDGVVPMANECNTKALLNTPIDGKKIGHCTVTKLTEAGLNKVKGILTLPEIEHALVMINEYEMGNEVSSTMQEAIASRGIETLKKDYNWLKDAWEEAKNRTCNRSRQENCQVPEEEHEPGLSSDDDVSTEPAKTFSNIHTKDFSLCPRKSNRTKKANKRYKG